VGGRHGVDLLAGETPAEVVDLLAGLEERDDLDRLVVAGLARLEDDFSPTVVDTSVDEVVSRLRAATR
jgi:hypothetical protein